MENVCQEWDHVCPFLTMFCRLSKCFERRMGRLRGARLGGGERDLEDYKQSFMTNSGIRSTCEKANSNVDAETVFLKCEMGT